MVDIPHQKRVIELDPVLGKIDGLSKNAEPAFVTASEETRHSGTLSNSPSRTHDPGREEYPTHPDSKKREDSSKELKTDVPGNFPDSTASISTNDGSLSFASTRIEIFPSRSLTWNLE